MLRIDNVNVVDSSNIEAFFTSKLSRQIGIQNVSINSKSLKVPNSNIISVKVSGNKLSIKCQPLTPYAVYDIIFKSTINAPFETLNGEASISEDEVSNLKTILGPPESENVIRDLLKSFLKENIYNSDDPNTSIGKLIESYSKNLSKCLYDIYQIKNENYISNTIVDEEKTRGSGPFDRLNEGGAYEILRVSKTKTGNKVSGSYEISNFNYYPVSLQSFTIPSENLQVDSENVVGFFNKNSLILNLKNEPVIKLKKVTFYLSSNPIVWEYPIDLLGYQLKNNKYDQDHAFKYLVLEDFQAKLNEDIIKNNLIDVGLITRVEVSYEYKDVGKSIYEDSLDVWKISTSSRESLPPIINIFDLKNAPIVDSNGNVATVAGVLFADPNNVDPSAKHPAFIKEIPFRLDALPSSPGQYSIDYKNGRVYVYGENLQNDGTGKFPPVATYKYKFSYVKDIDYVYDSEFNDLCALPKGSLLDNTAKVSFNYEKNLVNGVDFVANLHQESIFERVGNRLLNSGTLRTLNKPVQNVFRITNESTGEVYVPSRWEDDKVYFNYNTSPTLSENTFEMASFATSINELLTVSDVKTSDSSLKIFVINLLNNQIISNSEDCIGSFFNSSVRFENFEIFQNEMYFNAFAEKPYNILQVVGDYCIDYFGGIIYCAVSSAQTYDIGSVTYKFNKISTIKNNIISVEDIYYQINQLSQKNKNFDYSSFEEGAIYPINLDKADELFYKNDTSYPYQLADGKISFYSTEFENKVSNQVKQVRYLFEYDDLVNNKYPINLSEGCSFYEDSVSFEKVTKTLYTSIQQDDDGYLFVNIPIKTSYISPNLTFDISILRGSDQLWDSSGQIVPGDQIKLILSGVNSPLAGDYVQLTYSIGINNYSRIAIDYNKGDLYVDYTVAEDELLISYEYGDNVLDFRTSKTITDGTNYYVTYRVGALRDALARNFGSLLAIPELNVLNLDLERERYRDCVYAGLSSFIKGPTLESMKNLVKEISHVTPEIVESVFNNWSLGDSLLYPEQIYSTGNFSTVPLRFGNGVLINDNDQTISMPQSSNLSLSQGTFETWIMPEWDGIDNTSELSFKILKDNVNVNNNFIYIGNEESHPENNSNYFTLTKNSLNHGSPSTDKSGIFIYYDKDSSQLFDRWYVEVVDQNFDGYYNFEIKSPGKFYDVKNISDGYITTTTTANVLKVKIQNQKTINQKFTFICDKEHYILDSGEENDKNRLSIYKDSNGYINFRAIDRFKKSYSLGSDISGWKRGEKHFISASWKLNSENEKDEMHLFIDGFEVPNNIMWGQKNLPYPHEDFKTVNPELIFGAVDKDIVGSNDLSTIQDGYTVSSSVSIGAYDIDPGDILYVDDPLFKSSGYEIQSVNGNEVTLTEKMPVTLNNLNYSINKAEFLLKNHAANSSKISVSTLHSIFENIDLSTIQDSNTVVSSTSNFEDIKPGYLLRIIDSDFDVIYNILSVDGHELTLDQNMPVSKSNVTFYIYSNVENELPGIKSSIPYYQISSNASGNSVLTVTKGVLAKDLLILNTFGLNYRAVKTKYYCWSYQSSNIIPVRLPPPVNIESIKITRIIVDNSIIKNEPVKVFSEDSVYKPSNLEFGRQLEARIAGTKATFPITVTILGYDIDSPEVDGYFTNNITEEVIFTDYGKKSTTHNFIHVESVTVNSGGTFSFELREKNPITYYEGGDLVPVVKYSYQIASGSETLRKGSMPNTVIDDGKFFSTVVNGNILVISDPGSGPPEVTGVYKITDIVSEKELKLDIQYPMPDFTGASYSILNVLDKDSGFQNGNIILEQSQLVGSEYYLNRGYYEIEYDTFLSVKIDPLSNGKIYFGCDINGKNQANSTLDQVKIYDIALSDTRTGESIFENERSVTKDYNSLVALKADKNTLVLIDFDSYPFLNKASFYVKNLGKNFIQSDAAINDNFGRSVIFKNNSLQIDNFGILDTRKEGTIEFWVNPMYDAQHDPVERYYFDAYGAKSISLISENSTQIILNEPAERIISVTLDGSDPHTNYFSGGKLSYETNGAVQKEASAIRGDSMVQIPQDCPEAFQILSVTIKGDPSKKDYFGNGKIKQNDRRVIFLEKPLISNIYAQPNVVVVVTYKPINGNVVSNSQVINLNKKLPKDKSNVIVKFLPKGFKGDRLSIYKDATGILRFKITTTGSTVTENEVVTPIYWRKDTWHRIKASYKVNSKTNQDEMRLFIDGYERSSVLLDGSVNLTTNTDLSSMISGVSVGNRSINTNDTINQIIIGSDYSNSNGAYCLIDNLRISNISRPIYKPYNEAIDPAYSSNVSTIYPVTKDLYTTYLLDFDNSLKINEDFASIISKEGNNFNFGINIFDSFGIINDNVIVKQILEKLIKILKPANSKVFLKYF